MIDLKTDLHRLSEEAAPPGFDSIDAAVLARVARHSFSKEPLRIRAAAVGLALLIGIAGGMLPDAEAGAKPAGPALSEAMELAPSTLLVGAQ